MIDARVPLELFLDAGRLTAAERVASLASRLMFLSIASGCGADDCHLTTHVTRQIGGRKLT
ncbi:MAG: hypothetical protein ABI440_15330 [Casimicrobiaceae bacterium]